MRYLIVILLTIINCSAQYGLRNPALVGTLKTSYLMDNPPAAGGGGAFVFVKTNATQLATDTTTITVALPTVTAGNLIVLFVSHEGASTTISASDGTTAFTGRTIIDHAGGEPHSRILYLLSSVASGTVTYTVTFGASRPFKNLHAWEFSYTGTCVYDTEPTGGGATGTTSTNPETVVTGNLTTTGANSVCICGYGTWGGSSISEQTINSLTPNHITRSGDGLDYSQSFELISASTFTGQGSIRVNGSALRWTLNMAAFKTQ